MNAMEFLRKAATATPVLEAILYRPNGAAASPDEKAALKNRIELFLNATLDEVRLRRSDELAAHVLEINRAADTLHFRRGVTRRELGKSVHFPKQRDHSAHTINNYLLGWVVYVNNADFQAAFAQAVSARSWGDDVRFTPRRAFKSTWLYASLLHDIGYIFEGSLTSESNEHQFEHARLGATLVDEYLHSYQWLNDDLYSVSVRRAVETYHEKRFGGSSLGYVNPISRAETLLRLAQILSDTGPLHAISTTLGRELPEDIFNLWIEHYRAFGAEKMTGWIERARKVYISFVVGGLPGAGVRVVDHGIASGLIHQLAFSSYYEIWNTLKTASTDSNATRLLRTVATKITEKMPDAFSSFDTNAFWSWNTWAAAATAVHNVMQQVPGSIFGGDKLALSDDPLAFLGILVDILQEWDRYTVRREGAFAGALPVQGTEVFIDLESGRGRLIVRFENKKAHDDVKRGLDSCLQGWEALVDLQPP